MGIDQLRGRNKHLAALEDAGRSHARADAHRHHAIAELRVTLQAPHQGRGADRAGCSEGVAQCNGAAQRIDLGRIKPEGADHRQRLGSEGLVQFDPLELRLIHSARLERARDGLYGTNAHDFRGHARDRKADKAGQRAGAIVNYGERRRCGERISTGFVESTINQLIAKRFVKKQQMRWTPRGAHLLLQVRVHVLNDELGTAFQRWYPKLGSGQETQQAA